MSPEERDRLVKVEQIVAGQQETLKSIESKLDHLASIADMGKGALWLALKVGSVLAMLIATAWALFDKIFLKGTP